MRAPFSRGIVPAGAIHLAIVLVNVRDVEVAPSRRVGVRPAPQLLKNPVFFRWLYQNAIIVLLLPQIVCMITYASKHPVSSVVPLPLPQGPHLANLLSRAYCHTWESPASYHTYKQRCLGTLLSDESTRLHRERAALWQTQYVQLEVARASR